MRPGRLAPWLTLPRPEEPIRCTCGRVFADALAWRDHRRRHYRWSGRERAWAREAGHDRR